MNLRCSCEMQVQHTEFVLLVGLGFSGLGFRPCTANLRDSLRASTMQAASQARKGAPRAASDPAHWASSASARDGRARKEGAGVRAVLPTRIGWEINPRTLLVVHACVLGQSSSSFGAPTASDSRCVYFFFLCRCAYHTSLLSLFST